MAQLSPSLAAALAHRVVQLSPLLDLSVTVVIGPNQRGLEQFGPFVANNNSNNSG